MDENQKTALTNLLKDTKKKYGEVVIDKSHITPCNVIRTGSLAVDIAVGIGGLPRGRVVEISGSESSGKTTLSLQCIAEAQKNGGICAFIDAEHALDAQYAKNLGVNMDELVVSQPDTAEEIVGICLDWAASGLFSMLVIDSVAAMIPRAVLEGEVEDKHMALMGRLMSQNLPKVVKAVAKTDTCMLFINQMRSNLGASGPYGPTTTTTGGRALKFYCSLRLETARTGSNKDGETVTGNKVNIKVLKNKLAAPFTVAETNIVFGEGFDVNSEIIDIGVALKLIEKSGSWYAYNGERMGQGRDNSGVFLNENQEIRNSLIDKIRQMYNIA